MESKKFLFAAVPLLGLIVVFSYLNIAQQSPNESISEDLCQKVEYNGKDRIDLLFISSPEDAKRYTDVLLNSEPYKDKRIYFNSYVINQDVECKSYKGIAILCNTPEIQSLAKQCPHDYIIVVKKEKTNIRSSAYGNVLSINSAHDNSVLLHEFGHSFGNLAEEYGGAKLPTGQKNCVSSCDKFNGQTDSCDLECSESTYYRSIYAGVMRTLSSSDYGIYNKALLTELLEKNKPDGSSITGLQIEEDLVQCEQPIFEVSLDQSNQVVLTLDNVLYQGCTPDNAGTGTLCLDDLCYPNTLFTDAQDTTVDETIQGEVVIPEDPLTFYLIKDPSNPEVEIKIDGQLVQTIKTLEVGATACTI